MKNILFFSLSFLLACSFMAHAMMDTSDESAKVEQESYHIGIQEVVEKLKQNHPPTQKEYSLNPSSAMIGGRLVKKVILGRTNDKATDEGLAFIRQFDWEHGTRDDVHKAIDADQLKKVTDFAQYLKLANEAARVEWQEVNEAGDLVTTFASAMPFHTIGMIYFQVPEMGDVEECTE